MYLLICSRTVTMSTGGLTSYLFQEDEEKVSFDTQDVQRLESFIGRIENDLKKRGGASFNGGDGDTFLSDDDEWIMDATEITIPDQVPESVGIINIDEEASVSPVGESFSLPDQVPGSVGIITIEDGTSVGESFSLPDQVLGSDESTTTVKDATCLSPDQASGSVRIPHQQSILKKGKDRKMIYTKKRGVNENKKNGVNEKKEEKKKKKDLNISSCSRCSIIRCILTQGVKNGSGLDVQEDVEPLMIDLLSKKKTCKNCKKVLTILSG